MRMPRPNLHSENLATRLLELDPEAYREFANYFVCRFVDLFRSRGLAVSDAEDLAASCIVEIALKIGRYKPVKQASFDDWVFTLARHALADWWRDHKTTFISIDELTMDVAQERSRPNAKLVRTVREALARLSEQDRILMQLRNLQEENTFEEIGARMGITANAARVRHFRALNRLRLRLLEIDEKCEFLRAERW
jgi:RNA polymerase sigma factor (sigma-70 family)